MNIFITFGVRDGRMITLYFDNDEKAILEKTFKLSQRAPFGKYDMLGLLQVSDDGYARNVIPLEIEYGSPNPIGLRRCQSYSERA